jgi:hypothetical protein
LAEGDGADEDPLTMANKANLKRLSMDVLVNLLLSHETSGSYKKLIEKELERRRPKKTREERYLETHPPEKGHPPTVQLLRKH